MRSPKKLPPWSRHHENWCAIFRGKSCDCGDDGRRPQVRRRSPLSGGDVPPKRERQLEDA